MQPLTNKIKVVSNKKMTLAERLYLPAIVKGMAITLKHFFSKKTTVRYPEKKREYSDIYRGRHVLKLDDEGRERCTACGLCALACPAEAIIMTAAERKPGEENLYREEKYASVYEIDMLRCIFCGLCEEACPKEAIFLTTEIVKGGFERDVFTYGKDRLVEKADNRIDVTKRQTPEVIEFKKDKKQRHNK
jgi:NADH-quinone oxidoreductase subunit I